ncbi:U3 small nucleolar RNA-interacting protein 2-like isoform X3 [Phalacrocorax carbo]|uniref:U3 small nucleolar RNA-interacting protein 2-like isoform X3 n=1 Tax=Phalacrocorax carbo TaxID=9209 RepID=UPI003119B57F
MAAAGSCRAKAPRGAAGRRRPRAAVLGAERRSRAAAVRPVDEEVSSDSEPESPSLGRRRRREAAVEEEVEETPQEKKLRLAKLYLEELRQHEEEQAAAEEEEEETHPADLIGDRLKEDVVSSGAGASPQSRQRRRRRALPRSRGAGAASAEPPASCPAGAEGSAAAPGRQRREVESGKRLCVVPGGKKGTEERHMGHASHVLCMAISSDGKYLATGDRNKLIMVWDTATCKRLHIFTGHRDAVSGLSFRKGTHQLYSASHDRCVKVWNVAENAYMETLFGHQDIITGLDSLSRECCVTAGGRDGTVRLWKIPEESQLVFYGHQGSIDCIQLINEEHMVSGADDGSVALWGLAKKKPLALARQAHGMQDAQGLQQPYWISAVAALRNSDLLATGVGQLLWSKGLGVQGVCPAPAPAPAPAPGWGAWQSPLSTLGSHSASVKLWKCSEGFRKLEPLWAIPLV